MKATTEESTASSSSYAKESDSHSSSRSSSYEPLLESQRSIPDMPGRSMWNTILSPWSPIHRYKVSGSRTSDREDIGLGRRKGSRLCLKAGLGMLSLLGIVQLLSLIGNLAVRAIPNDVHRKTKTWGRPGHVGAGLSSWPTDFSQGILPIPCHSHNDYWRTVPLFSAIEVGCVGVEADVWLFDKQLYVGHSIASLTPNRTLDSLYIEPLLDILSKQNPKPLFLSEISRVNGVFDTTPEQSLILLIDFKTAGGDLWPYVQAALEPLRSQHYLTRFNGSEIIPGPITVVGTGNTPFDLVDSDLSNPHHDVFFDAPLSGMLEQVVLESGISAAASKAAEPEPEPSKASTTNATTVRKMGARTSTSEKRSDGGGQGKSGIPGDDPNVFNTRNAYYASVAFGEAIGRLQDGRFSNHQMDSLRGQIRGAHKRGLKARYWDLPFWPIDLRNHVWDVLVREGVDMLNVDDLKGAAKRDWSKHQGWWKWSTTTPEDVHGNVESPMGSSAHPPS